MRTRSHAIRGRSERGGPYYFYGDSAVAQPLMPHATASWLVDNTALSFEQIAEFCGLHILEVQAIADDTAATKLTGRDPVRAHELTQEEIEKGQADPDYTLKMHQGPRSGPPHQGPALHAGVEAARTSPTASPGSSATIPEISDGAIGKLIGTTRTTIAAIRDRSHWNIANITPKDPVTLGLTSQRELDAAVAKAAKAAGIEAAGRHPARGRPRGADRASSAPSAPRPRCDAEAVEAGEAAPVERTAKICSRADAASAVGKGSRALHPHRHRGLDPKFSA